MAALLDLTGKRFGRLIVQDRDQTINRRTRWRCLCDCGNIAVVGSRDLVARKTQSCGCLKHGNLLGKRFGRLLVVEKMNYRDHRSTVWKCVCDCGNVVISPARSLIAKTHATRSCGCLKQPDLTGRRFGKLQVVENTKRRVSDGILWKCICDCGMTVFTTPHSLNSGNTRSCGCLRVDCVRSHGEENVTSLLDDWGYQFFREFRFSDCKRKFALPFDFCVAMNDRQWLIEYQGVHHYRPIEKFGGETRYKATQDSDRIKFNYCQERNIPLLLIPYWEDAEALLRAFLPPLSSSVLLSSGVLMDCTDYSTVV